MNVPFIDLKAQYKSIKEDIDVAIKNIIENTSFIMGELVKRFEEHFANYCKAKFAIGVSSGTAALHQALLAAGIKPGDEIITVPHTFIATVEPIFELGAKPVFVYFKEDGLIDIEKIPEAITKKTKAILPVHLYGKPVDISQLSEIIKNKNIKIIEDCAQAHGAEIKKKRIPISDIGCFSFYPGKNLGSYGDAGAVVTNNEEIAKKVSMLRDHGRISKYEHLEIGFNERMDTLQAAIVDAKLKYIEEWTEKRINHAKLYNNELRGITKTPEITDNIKHVFHLYVIQIKKRNELQKFLKESNISTGIHYPIPLHLQPALKSLGYKKGDFPTTERLSNEVLSLPMYPELTNEQIAHVCKKIKEFFGG